MGDGMHTVMIVGGGFLLLVVFLIGAKVLSRSVSTAALLFIPVWFACAAYNMWIGISTAGYTFMEELPIFIGIFAVPAIVALIVSRRARV